MAERGQYLNEYAAGAIQVVQRSNDIMAHITGNRAIWGCGATEVEALGCLLRTDPEACAEAIVRHG